MARLSPPAVGTRVRAATESVWLDGDVELRGGVGAAFRHHLNDPAIILDAEGADKPQSRSLFIPGSIPTRELARITLPNDAAIVSLVEANLLTAPTADATNHQALRIRGSVSGTLDLAMGSATTRFTTDLASPVVVLGQTYRARNRGAASDGGHRGISTTLVPSADQTVTAIGLRMVAPAVTKRIEILDENRQPLVSFTDSAAWTGAEIVHQLPYSLDLAQGNTYVVAVSLPGYTTDDPAGDTIGYYGANDTEATYVGGTSALFPELPADDDPHSQRSRTGFIANDVAEAGFGWDDPWGPQSPFTGGNEAGGQWIGVHPYVGIYGSPTGVTITGDLIIETVDVGTGPTAPGADANVYLRIVEG